MFFNWENIQLLLLYTLSGLCGTVGYTLINRMRRKRIIGASLGGAMGVLVWYVCLYYSGNIFLSNMAAAFSVSVYSEIMARLLKTPASTFCIITLIPLVPGSALYYTMTYALRGNLNAFISKAIYTIELSVALSLGIVIVISIDKYVSFKLKEKREKKGA